MSTKGGFIVPLSQMCLSVDFSSAICWGKPLTGALLGRKQMPSPEWLRLLSNKSHSSLPINFSIYDKLEGLEIRWKDISNILTLSGKLSGGLKSGWKTTKVAPQVICR